MFLLQETLRRYILQILDNSADEHPAIDVNFVLEADTPQLQQIFDDIKKFRNERARQKQVIETSELISFEEAIKFSGHAVVLSKWAEARFKEFFIKQRDEDKFIKDIYAQTSSGNLFVWDLTSEKWKKVK
jgi:hypothetical protein